MDKNELEQLGDEDLVALIVHKVERLSIGDQDILLIRYSDPPGFVDTGWVKALALQLRHTLNREVPIFVLPADGMQVDAVSLQKLEESVNYLKELHKEESNELSE